MGLKYVSTVGAAADGIPARDLTDAEVEALGGEKFLLSLDTVGPLYAKPSGGKAQVREGAKAEPQPAAEAAEDKE